MREKAGLEGAVKTHLLAWLTFDTLDRQPHETQGTGKRETGREKKRMRDRHGQQESMLMAQQLNKKKNHCEEITYKYSRLVTFWHIEPRVKACRIHERQNKGDLETTCNISEHVFWD